MAAGLPSAAREAEVGADSRRTNGFGKITSNFNYICVSNFILNGAPFRHKLSSPATEPPSDRLEFRFDETSLIASSGSSGQMATKIAWASREKLAKKGEFCAEMATRPPDLVSERLGFGPKSATEDRAPKLDRRFRYTLMGPKLVGNTLL